MTLSNMRHSSVPQPQGVVHVLNQLDELQTCIGGRLDALIWHEAELAKRADRQARWAARMAVALVFMTVLACVYSWRS